MANGSRRIDLVGIAEDFDRVGLRPALEGRKHHAGKLRADSQDHRIVRGNRAADRVTHARSRTQVLPWTDIVRHGAHRDTIPVNALPADLWGGHVLHSRDYLDTVKDAQVASPEGIGVRTA